MFPHKLLLPLGALLLSGLVGASSSGAQDALFVRTQGEIERLWSSALGCAERGSSFAIRDRFNGSESTYGSLPAGGSSDYSQCGERALRNTSSRMLVDTIEDAVRSGGLSLFNSDFRLDSSINWIWGENVTGDLDAVVPLLLIGKEDQGSGHALFLQPGLSFWPGLEDERRLDGNLGVVYRTRMADGLVAGGSFFYDYDVKNDNRRIGVGLDLQDRALHAGLNYYHPLNEWQEGRTDYEEQPLQGGDFRLGLALQRAWLDASMGVWRFEGEGKTKWRPSLGMDAGIRILPGVFLKGGYEWQDEDDSFGTRWSTGLAFRFALPGLDGAGSFNSPPVPAPNLFDPVEREKRILYEEREAVPKANLSVSGTGNTRNVIVQLDEIFTEDVVLNFIGSGSATYNDDWTMSVGGTDCAAVTGTNCQVTVMAGETSPSDGVVITFQDPDRGEPAEDIILSVEIASTGVDLAPGNPLIVQIPAGLPLPNISLSSDKTSIAEGDTATITLTLSEMLGDAAAFNLIGSSDSNDVTYGTSTDDDWNLSIGGTACDMASGTSCQVTIAAGATSAEVTVEVNADTTNETSVEAFTVSVAVDSGSRNIVQTGSRSTLNFTIPEDPPSTLGFAETGITTDETISTGSQFIQLRGVAKDADGMKFSSIPVRIPITISITNNAGNDITIDTSPGQALTPANTDNFNSDNEFLIQAIRIVDDTDTEDQEEFVITLGEGPGFPAGWAIDPDADTFTITINKNDQPSTLGFAETGITTDETISAGNQFIQVRGVAKDADGMKFSRIPVRIPITISITNNAGNDISIDTSPGQALTPANTDNFNSDNEFLIQAIRIVDDTDAEEQEEFVVTLGEGPSFPSGWAIDPDADTFTITINRNDQPSTLGFAGTGITTDETISTGNQFIQLRGVAKDADGMKFSSIPVRIPITISITNNAGNDITIDTSSGQALTPAGTDNFNSDNEFLIQAIRIVDDTDAEDQEEFVITLGEGPSFPDGWVIDSDADTFTIVINGNDRPTVFFSGGDGTQSVPRTITDTIDEGAGGSATVTLNLSPAPTTAINIPLTVTGNHAVYGDVIIANTTRAAVLGNPSTNDVRVSVPANIGMVILRITVVQDSGNNSDDITVSLGALPGDYAAGTNNSWAVAINFPRTVNFAYEGEHSLRTSTNPETAEVADLSLELSKTHNEDITVHLNKGGTAGATNGDYRILNQDGSICGADNEVCVVTFPPGQKEAAVKFWPRRYFSGSETAIINIQIPEGSKDSVQLGKQDEIQFNLIDGTASAVLPTVTLSYTGDRILTSSTTSEIAEIVDLKVQLNNSSSVPIAVHLNKGGTTRAGSGDYRILNADDSICGNDDESCIVTFLAGQTEVVVKFWPRRYIAEQETAVIELEVPAENRDKVALGLNNRVEFTLVPGI